MLRPRYLVLGVLLLPSLVARPMLASSTCSELTEWARPWADRAPTLAEMTAFDDGHRRALFSVLRPEARVSLWREQIDLLAHRSDVTESQRSALNELRASVVPDIYTKGSAARTHVGELWSRHQTAFSPPLQRALMVLGGDNATAAHAITTAAQVNWCNCSPSWGHVECAPGACGPAAGCITQDGCGFSGTLECTRKCVGS